MQVPGKCDASSEPLWWCSSQFCVLDSKFGRAEEKFLPCQTYPSQSLWSFCHAGSGGKHNLHCLWNKFWNGKPWKVSGNRSTGGDPLLGILFCGDWNQAVGTWNVLFCQRRLVVEFYGRSPDVSSVPRPDTGICKCVSRQSRHAPFAASDKTVPHYTSSTLPQRSPGNAGGDCWFFHLIVLGAIDARGHHIHVRSLLHAANDSLPDNQGSKPGWAVANAVGLFQQPRLIYVCSAHGQYRWKGLGRSVAGTESRERRACFTRACSTHVSECFRMFQVFVNSLWGICFLSPWVSTAHSLLGFNPETLHELWPFDTLGVFSE